MLHVLASLPTKLGELCWVNVDKSSTMEPSWEHLEGHRGFHGAFSGMLHLSMCWTITCQKPSVFFLKRPAKLKTIYFWHGCHYQSVHACVYIYNYIIITMIRIINVIIITIIIINISMYYYYIYTCTWLYIIIIFLYIIIIILCTRPLLKAANPPGTGGKCNLSIWQGIHLGRVFFKHLPTSSGWGKPSTVYLLVSERRLGWTWEMPEYSRLFWLKNDNNII